MVNYQHLLLSYTVKMNILLVTSVVIVCTYFPIRVEVGNPNMVWTASENGQRQHDFRDATSCPPAGSSQQECRNVLLDLRGGAKRSLVDPPRHTLALISCGISSTRPYLLVVGRSDAFARLYME